MSTREASFREIMTSHDAVIGRIVAGYAPTGPDRDDLFQEVALAIWRALPSFRGESSLKTFLFRVAHNRCLQHVLRQRTRVVEGVDELPDPSASPERLALQNEARVELFAAVRTLPLSLRQVVMLSLEGLDYQEIAATLGITENAAMARASRGRARLRLVMGSERR